MELRVSIHGFYGLGSFSKEKCTALGRKLGDPTYSTDKKNIFQSMQSVIQTIKKVVKNIWKKITDFFYGLQGYTRFTPHYRPIVVPNPIEGQTIPLVYYPPKNYSKIFWRDQANPEIARKYISSKKHGFKELVSFKLPSSPQTLIEVALMFPGFKPGITEQSKMDAIVSAANPEFTGGGGIAGVIKLAMGANHLDPQTKKLQQIIKEKVESGEDEIFLPEETQSYTYYGKPGSVAITSAGKMGALSNNKLVLHAVAPNNQRKSLENRILSEQEKEMALFSVYMNIFTAVTDYNESIDENKDKIKQLAIPALGTGIYAFPHLRAAHIASRAIQEFNASHIGELKRIRFVLDEKDFKAYMQVLEDRFKLTNLPKL